MAESILNEYLESKKVVKKYEDDIFANLGKLIKDYDRHFENIESIEENENPKLITVCYEYYSGEYDTDSIELRRDLVEAAIKNDWAKVAIIQREIKLEEEEKARIEAEEKARLARLAAIKKEEKDKEKRYKKYLELKEEFENA